MKKQLVYIMLFCAVTLFTACENTNWDEHYNNVPETVDMNVWDAMQQNSDISQFVQLVKEYKLDTLFNYTDVYTLFAPTNAQMSAFLASDTIGKTGLSYHFLKYYINPENITGKRKVQSLFLKFAQFENTGDSYLYDNFPVTFSSPLYKNGRYFVIEGVAKPKPSLYEYISANNLALKKFIDDQDSIALDKELSKPIGYNSEGKTIYDSVITVINLFEEEYYAVSEEYRVKTATLVFPNQERYNEGLTGMALKLGGDYNSYEDIPEDWQQEVLIPYLINNGIFRNMLEPKDFLSDTMLNIIGDTATILYNPVDLTVCSNGYAYNYDKFEVADTLFMSSARTEGESLLDTKGADIFEWNDSVKVSDIKIQPDADFVKGSSNDSILKVQLPTGSIDEYWIDFKSNPLFPRRYLMLFRTHMDFGGIFEIYVNDVLVKTFDWADFAKNRGIIPSVVPGVRHIAVGRYCKFDCWVDNITQYGKARIRIVYKGPSTMRYNGLMLDYIEFVPENRVGSITKNP